MKLDKLFANLYSDDYASPTKLAGYNPQQIGDLMISWESPGGIIDMAMSIIMNKSEAYHFYRSYALQRMALYDGRLDKPMTGDIAAIDYRWGKVLLGIKGPWWRLYDGIENSQADYSDTTENIIKNALANHASSVINSDQSNMSSTGAHCTQAMPSGTCTGTTAGKLVDSGATFSSDLIQVGDIAKDQTGGSHTTITAIDSETQLSVAEDIFISGDGYEIYRTLASGRTTDTKTNYLSDANADFLRAYVKNGDRVFNSTDKSWVAINAAPAKTLLSISSNAFTRDEQYLVGTKDLRWHPAYEGIPVADVITEMSSYGNGSGAPMYFWLQDAQFDGNRLPQKPLPYFKAYSGSAAPDWTVRRCDMREAKVGRDFRNLATSVLALWGMGEQGTAQTNNTDTYWTRSRAISGYNAIPSLADQRASVYVNQNSDGVLRRPWIITTPRIADANGLMWPLWRVLMAGGGYLQCSDAFPETAMATAGYDRERSGRITTMDYDYKRNQLRVTLDDDTRADRRFRDLGTDESLQRRLRHAGIIA